MERAVAIVAACALLAVLPENSPLHSSSRSAAAANDGIPIEQTLDMPGNASFVDAGFIVDGFGSVEIRNLRVAATP